MVADHNSLWERTAWLELKTVKSQLILIDRNSGPHSIKLFTRLREIPIEDKALGNYVANPLEQYEGHEELKDYGEGWLFLIAA